jgi:muramoyltetrapeptide carboxypeptidase
MPSLDPLKPPPLRSGDPVALVSPSGPAPAAAIDAASAYLSQRGHPVRLGTHVKRRHHYLAGDDDQRLADLEAAFADPQIKAIFCTRGGYGSSRLLDRLDYDLIRRNPKIVIGFSDTTALHLGLYARTRLVGLTGFLAAYDLSPDHKATAQALWHALGPDYTASLPLGDQVQVLRPGRARGRLVGGCLSLLVHLLGTPYQPDFDDALLLLEDVGETPYRIDRMLCQLRLAGVFDRIGGLLLGRFRDCDDAQQRPPLIKDIALDLLGRRAIPVLSHLPYGHFPQRLVLPLGIEFDLSTHPCNLRQCESAFA